MTNTSNRVFDRSITIAFLSILSLAAIWTLSKGLWMGSLFDGNQTWLIDMNNQPVWNPPARPAYADFQKVFKDLPQVPPDKAIIGIELEWDFMLFGFVVQVFCVSVLFGILSLTRPSGKHSLAIFLIRSLAVSLSGAAVILFVVGLIVGGWESRSLFVFSAIGLAVGVWRGVTKWQRQG